MSSDFSVDISMTPSQVNRINETKQRIQALIREIGKTEDNLLSLISDSSLQQRRQQRRRRDNDDDASSSSPTTSPSISPSISSQCIISLAPSTSMVDMNVSKHYKDYCIRQGGNGYVNDPTIAASTTTTTTAAAGAAGAAGGGDGDGIDVNVLATKIPSQQGWHTTGPIALNTNPNTLAKIYANLSQSSSSLSPSISSSYSIKTSKLSHSDMYIFGHQPAVDSLALVRCSFCKRIIRSVAILSHMGRFHSIRIPSILKGFDAKSGENNVDSALLALVDPPLMDRSKSDRINNSRLRRSSSESMIRNDSATSPFKLQRNLSPNPCSDDNASSFTKKVTSSSSTSNIVPVANSVTTSSIDRNRHCGVMLPRATASGTHCQRSLTCSVHTVSAKRAVEGRSESFDVLLSRHLGRPVPTPGGLVVGSGMTTNQLAANAASVPSNMDTSDSDISADDIFRGIDDDIGDNDGDNSSKWLPQASTMTYLRDDHIEPSGEPPTPLASCSFGARAVGEAGYSFGRRGESLRRAFIVSLLSKQQSAIRHPSVNSTTVSTDIRMRKQLQTQQQQLTPAQLEIFMNNSTSTGKFADKCTTLSTNGSPVVATESGVSYNRCNTFEDWFSPESLNAAVTPTTTTMPIVDAISSMGTPTTSSAHVTSATKRKYTKRYQDGPQNKKSTAAMTAAASGIK